MGRAEGLDDSAGAPQTCGCAVSFSGARKGCTGAGKTDSRGASAELSPRKASRSLKILTRQRMN